MVENEQGKDEVTIELVVLSPSAKPLGPLECLDVCAESCTLAWKAPTDDGGCPIQEYKVEMLCPKTKTWKKIGMCNTLQLTFNNFVKAYLDFRFVQGVRGVGPPGAPSLQYPVTDLQEGEEYKFR